MRRFESIIDKLLLDNQLENAINDKERIEDNVLRVLFDIVNRLDRIESELNGRTSRRNITKDENKRTHRGRPKKVCDDKGTTDRVCDEVQ